MPFAGERAYRPKIKTLVYRLCIDQSLIISIDQSFLVYTKENHKRSWVASFVFFVLTIPIHFFAYVLKECVREIRIVIIPHRIRFAIGEFYIFELNFSQNADSHGT